MRRRIVVRRHLVCAGRHDFAVSNHNGAKWPTTAAGDVFRGQMNGLLHELGGAFTQTCTLSEQTGCDPAEHGIISIMVHALCSQRVVTPQGEREAAVLIDGELIVAVKPVSELSADVPREDFGDVALLPGMVDLHTHINEPGRTEWEGFATATRAAAAGGFTTVIDMPLNCLPETTDPDALEEKRRAASSGGPGGGGQCL